MLLYKDEVVGVGCLDGDWAVHVMCFKAIGLWVWHNLFVRMFGRGLIGEGLMR